MIKWAAAALAGLLTIGITPAVAALEYAHPHVMRTKLCSPNGHLIVHSASGTRYAIRNAYWLGQRPQCISVKGDYTDFKVVQEAGADPHGGKVVAYPDIFRGCIWHICSPRAHLPRLVSRLGHPTATWHTEERAPGTWNAAFDIWFGKKKMKTGQANGAELMIWLNENGACCALQRGAPKVWIDGQQWWLSHWTAVNGPVSWNYVQFRRVHKTWHTSHLRIRPFIRRIERMGLVRPQWWLENIETGFEIWNGGKGLTTTRYRVWGITH